MKSFKISEEGRLLGVKPLILSPAYWLRGLFELKRRFAEVKVLRKNLRERLQIFLLILICLNINRLVFNIF